MALAYMGKHVTRFEAHGLFNEVDVDDSGEVTRDEWVGFYTKKMQPSVDEEAIERAWDDLHRGCQSKYDENDDAYVEAGELRHILVTFGDRLSNDDGDLAVRECLPDGKKRIYYEGYRGMLLDEVEC